MTPEEKLCSRSWRLRNSAGILWSILSMGVLTGVGFLIRGIKAKNKLWIGVGVVFLVLGIGIFEAKGTFDSGTKEHPIYSTALEIWGWAWFLIFAGGVTASIITNRKWLIWKAHSTDTKWYANAGATPRANVSSGGSYDPDQAAAAALSTPAPRTTVPVPTPVQGPVQTPVQATGGSLDVNSASAQQFEAALGVDAATANRIIEARQAVGSFSSFEQLMSKAQVPPHLLIPHRSNLVFGTPADAPGQQQPEPPSIGAQTGRRLFD